MGLGSGNQEGRPPDKATIYETSSSTSFLFRCPFATRFPENRVVGGREGQSHKAIFSGRPLWRKSVNKIKDRRNCGKSEAKTACHVVIARSEATKQSRTGSPRPLMRSRDDEKTTLIGMNQGGSEKQRVMLFLFVMPVLVSSLLFRK
jgi:hypothetical protein